MRGIPAWDAFDQTTPHLSSNQHWKLPLLSCRTWNSMGARGRHSGVDATVALFRMARSSPAMARMLPAGTSCGTECEKGYVVGTQNGEVLPSNGQDVARGHLPGREAAGIGAYHEWSRPTMKDVASRGLMF